MGGRLLAAPVRNIRADSHRLLPPFCVAGPRQCALGEIPWGSFADRPSAEYQSRFTSAATTFCVAAPRQCALTESPWGRLLTAPVRNVRADSCRLLRFDVYAI